jgi:hypothetical protein
MHPEPAEPPVPPRIGLHAVFVAAAIDLDDELHLGGIEVRDVPPGERHLPSKRDPERATPQRFEDFASESVGACRIS